MRIIPLLCIDYRDGIFHPVLYSSSTAINDNDFKQSELTVAISNSLVIEFSKIYKLQEQ